MSPAEREEEGRPPQGEPPSSVSDGPAPAAPGEVRTMERRARGGRPARFVTGRSAPGGGR